MSETTDDVVVEDRRDEAFARQATEELAGLRKDAAVWDDYLAEAEGTAVIDGVR